MKKTGLALFAILAAFVVTSCTTRLTDFTVISSKNVDLSQMAKYKKGGDRVIGEDIAHIIFVIPTGMPNLKEAIDKAIESVPGCVALADGVMSSKSFWILVYGQQGFIVEGTPLIDPALASVDDLESKYMISEIDEEGNSSLRYVSEEEYNEVKAEYAD